MSTVLSAAVSADQNWFAALLSDGTVHVLLTDPTDPAHPPAWRQMPVLPSGTPVPVGVSEGGAAVVTVMEDGACYKLLNEPVGSTAMTWLALPTLPTGV